VVGFISRIIVAMLINIFLFSLSALVGAQDRVYSAKEGLHVRKIGSSLASHSSVIIVYDNSVTFRRPTVSNYVTIFFIFSLIRVFWIRYVYMCPRVFQFHFHDKVPLS
jgi:hypothetical protein